MDQRTWLLYWNPTKSSAVPEYLGPRRADVDKSWSLSGTKQVRYGDSFLLLRTGRDPRGLVGWGTFTSDPFDTPEWGLEAGVAFEHLAELPVIDRERLLGLEDDLRGPLAERRLASGKPRTRREIDPPKQGRLLAADLAATIVLAARDAVSRGVIQRPAMPVPFAESKEDPEAILDEREEARINEAEIPEIEKEQLIKARRGQGIFRDRVEEIETTCRMTGVNDKRFLIASHIKPWRASDSVEKLDGSNGLLLSPHVDKLFDQGWISFSDDGKVLCDNDDIRRLMIQWGLDPDKYVGAFNPEQRKYLAYHRGNIYKA